MIIIINITTGG